MKMMEMALNYLAKKGLGGDLEDIEITIPMTDGEDKRAMIITIGKLTIRTNEEA